MDSILNQTFQGFEYIILNLNNGSTDLTAKFLMVIPILVFIYFIRKTWELFALLMKGIRKYLSSFNPFSHSSIIFRKKAFLGSGGYKQNFECTHEYELWVLCLILEKLGI